jgi:hypothetical protein
MPTLSRSEDQMSDARVVRSLLAALAVLVVEMGAGGAREARAQTPHADFNGDGFDDIAVGVPLEDVGTASDAGAVNVIYGSAGGLSDVGDQLWTQQSFGVFDAAEIGDHFGEALATGGLQRRRLRRPGRRSLP